MKTLTQIGQAGTPKPFFLLKRLENYFIKPLRAGFWGFIIILTIIFFIHLISYVFGINKNIGFDRVDLSLAGMGFLLQLTVGLIKNSSK